MNSALKQAASITAADMAKAKQINIRLTAEQERLLRQHCVRERVTLRDVVIDALAHRIDGFDAK